MALKALLATLDSVPEELAKEYKKGDDGRYYLDLEGVDEHPAVGALKRAKDREKDDRLKAEAKVKELAGNLETLTEEKDGLLKGMVPKDHVEKLETSYREKITKKETDWAAREKELLGAVNGLTVESAAITLANKIAIDPKVVPLLMPHILPRLSVEIVGTKASTRVLDKEGKPSAASLDDFEKELIDTPLFSPIVKGSQASGGGANGGTNKSGALGGSQKVDFTKATTAEGVNAILAKYGEDGEGPAK